MRKKNVQVIEKNLLKFEAKGREFANFLRSLDQFFLAEGQNNFGNKIPFQPKLRENPSVSNISLSIGFCPGTFFSLGND